MNTKNWLLLFALSVIWAGAFLFAKVAVREVPVPTLVFLRVFIAALTLHIVLKISGKRFPWTFEALRPFLLMGLLNNAIPFSLLFWGQTQIAAGLASILNATTPIFAFLIAGVVQRQEPVTGNRIIGVGISVLAVALLFSGELIGAVHSPLTAQIACLGAAFSYGLAAAYAKRFKGMPPLVSATGQLTGSSLLLFPFAILTANHWSPSEVSTVAWVNIVALGIIATALAYLIYFRLLSEAGATNAALVTLLIPANTVVLGYIFLGETLGLLQLGGFAILLFGLIVLDGRAFKRSAVNTSKCSA